MARKSKDGGSSGSRQTGGKSQPSEVREGLNPLGGDHHALWSPPLRRIRLSEIRLDVLDRLLQLLDGAAFAGAAHVRANTNAKVHN